MSKETKASKPIKVTDNFRILQDSNQYTVQQLHKIDPTNSPKFDPEKHKTELRYEWKDSGYYGLSTSGLEAAIKAIILREAGLSDGDDVSLMEYLESLREISDRVHKVVSMAM